MKTILIVLISIGTFGSVQTNYQEEQMIGRYVVAAVQFRNVQGDSFKDRIRTGFLTTRYRFAPDGRFIVRSKQGKEKGLYKVTDNNLVLYFPKKTLELGKLIRVKSRFTIESLTTERIILNQPLDDSAGIVLTLKRI